MTTFAMLFPGQGSQSLGMLSSMAKTFPLIIKTFSQASDALGYDLWALTQEGPVSELNKTCKTQPALLTASVDHLAGLASRRRPLSIYGGRP